MSAHPTALQLERYHARECLGQDQARVRSHLDSCVACRQHIADLACWHESFLVAHPAAPFLQKLEARARRERTLRSRKLALSGLSVSAAAVALLVVGVGLRAPRLDGSAATSSAVSRTADVDLRSKGSAGFALILQRGDHQELRHGNLRVRDQDLLRMRFTTVRRLRLKAGIRTDAGSWVPWFDREFEAGTYTPEETLRVDAEPSSGRIYFGEASSVDRALETGDDSQVETAELEWTRS